MPNQSDDKRKHDVKLAVEEIYYQVYIPRFNKAKGIPTIGQRYFGGCSEGALTKVMHLAIKDAYSSEKKGLKDFSLYLVSEQAVINNKVLTESEVTKANFINHQLSYFE